MVTAVKRIARDQRFVSHDTSAAPAPKQFSDIYESLAGAVFVDGGYEAMCRVFQPSLHAFIDTALDYLAVDELL